MTYYISGPMKKKADNNKEAFFKAEEYLADDGNAVLNPARLPSTLPDNKYLPICMAMIDACDIIYMLDGWEDSDGAIAEYYYAKRQGKGIYL